MKQILILIAFLIFASLADAQTKQPEIKSSVRFELPEVNAIIAQLDTLSVVAVRSDMDKTDRRITIDRLKAIREFIIARFEQQNVKQDSVKAKGK